MSDWTILSREEGAFAETLSKLGHLDWVHIIDRLSESSKDELRAAVGTLIAEGSTREERGS